MKRPRLVSQRLLPRDDAELEQTARLERTERVARTRDDIDKLERERLGPSWGRRRRPMQGWPS